MDIQQRDYTPADVFSEGYSYTNFIEGWRADKIAKNARQFFSDARTSADVDFLLIGAFREGVEPAMRAMIDGVAFDIISAFDPDNKRRLLYVTVKRRDND